MSEFLSSTQLEHWTLNSLDAWKERVKRTQKAVAMRIEKYT